jgi:hypothetical protein
MGKAINKGLSMDDIAKRLKSAIEERYQIYLGMHSHAAGTDEYHNYEQLLKSCDRFIVCANSLLTFTSINNTC